MGLFFGLKRQGACLCEIQSNDAVPLHFGFGLCLPCHRYVPKECEETLEEDEIEEVPNDTQVDLALEALKEVAIKADDLLNGRTGGSKASTPVAGKSQAKKGDRRSSGKPGAEQWHELIV